MRAIKTILISTAILWGGVLFAQNSYSFKLLKDNSIEIQNQGVKELFRPDFIVLYSDKDPKMEYKNLQDYSHFAPSWIAKGVPAEKIVKERGKNNALGGDGIDKSLDLSKDARTYDIFYSAQKVYAKLQVGVEKGDTINFSYAEDALFSLSAQLFMDSSTQMPKFRFTLNPKTKGFFSVGYLGSPHYDMKNCIEVWQPFVWKQKLFPPMSYLTPAFLCPIPTALISVNNYTVGVVVPPSEFPFQPLPSRYNNRFGVALRDEQGKASPMVFAPVLGQLQSEMNTGDRYSFSFLPYLAKKDMIFSFESLAQQLYEFNDYRTNSISTVNQTIDNTIDYSLSVYSNYIDSLRGCSYATDVPGAVKNVSSLQPLEIAIITDNKQMFDKRALPIMEYMLSRKKDLFSLGKNVKTQNPSREMGGPCAYPSEIGGIYYLSGKKMNMLLNYVDTVLNKSKYPLSNSWYSALSLYQNTGDSKYLEATVKGADKYVNSMQMSRDLGYWDNIVKCEQLLDLYETTRDKSYLDASVLEAKRYAMQSWFSPLIPNEKILVNKGGKAPIYWYLANRGFSPQIAPEEIVPAWRLSEVGLLPESTITCIGHRGIFMAHHAPVFLRLAAYTNDEFLRNIARSAILGRYRNFPGYHINTERSTAQEQVDFPLRKHQEITVSSMHYNHILPFITNLFDYLVSDVFDRSKQKIHFPSQFIESYGYLVNRFYGYNSGSFYDYKDVKLWMPQHLLTTTSVELNYISARDNNNLYLAFTNQLFEEVNSTISFNTELLPQLKGKTFEAELITSNKAAGKLKVVDAKINFAVPAKGITALVIKNVKVKAAFQEEILNNNQEKTWNKDLADLSVGSSTAMLINMGKNLKYIYVYLRENDSNLNKATLNYIDEKGKEKLVADYFFPYEFEVKLSSNAKSFRATLKTYAKDGKQKSEEFQLNK